MDGHRHRHRSSNRARGQFGEDLAARHYLEAGYELLDRNWRCPLGELDLVAGRGALTVFCEVKARRSEAFGPPASAITPAKQRRICLLAFEWLRVHDRHGPIRFDVAAITGTQLDLIEHAFE
jgi:putative endonuclease